MQNVLTLSDLDVGNKRVLVRVDFNVPRDKQTCEVTDDKRIRAALPTIQHLLENKAKVILCSHLGRPKGGVKEELRLGKVAERLGQLLGKNVTKLDDCVGEGVQKITEAMQPGDVILLENLRFHPEEEKNDPGFAKQLSSLADLFVNDAFGTMHRAHASTAGVTEHLKSAAGLLVQKELEALAKVDDPEHPYVAILGGSKVTDKIGVIKNLLTKVDHMLIGGAMMFSFLKAKGYEIGKSKCDEESITLAKEFLGNEKIILPVDTVIAPEFKEDAQAKVVSVEEMPNDQLGLDIGPGTVELFSSYLKEARTVVWGGPMGVFEFDRFAEGTSGIAKALAESEAISIVGGGDSAAAVAKIGLENEITHVSTGGGATLEYLEGKKLPGIAALERSVKN